MKIHLKITALQKEFGRVFHLLKEQKTKETKTMSKYNRVQLNHYSNQNNPNNHCYQDRFDNYANQCNPNNDKYHNSRK